jgi:signal transduction histidine kinase
MPTGPAWHAATFWPLLLVAGALGVGLAAALAWRWWRHEQVLRGALHEAREAQRALDELADAWVWRSDKDQRIVALRPPAGRIAPEVISQAIGRPAGEVFRTGPSTALAALLESRAPLDRIDVTIGAGEAAPQGLLAARALQDAGGGPDGHLGTVRPVAIEAAAEPARDAMRAEYESFTYTVSHDLRAPLRVVEGFSRIVKEDYGRQLDRMGHDHLDRVMAAAARMNGMIDALLALSKLSTQPIARQSVNLSQLAGFVIEELRRQSPARQVSVQIEPGLVVQGDPMLLRLVLENLLGNAWKYSAKKAEAEIAFGRSGADTFTVRDNGAGFDMRFADRLFGAFQRLHSTTDFQGTGIGLASVRRIVRRHGGEVWAESEVGRGASFHFSLPQRDR